MLISGLKGLINCCLNFSKLRIKLGLKPLEVTDSSGAQEGKEFLELPLNKAQPGVQDSTDHQQIIVQLMDCLLYRISVLNVYIYTISYI